MRSNRVGFLCGTSARGGGVRDERLKSLARETVLPDGREGCVLVQFWDCSGGLLVVYSWSTGSLLDVLRLNTGGLYGVGGSGAGGETGLDGCFKAILGGFVIDLRLCAFGEVALRDVMACIIVGV